MTPGPVVRAVLGGLAHRRAQTAVVGLVLVVSTGTSVLALGLLADSSAPFDHAFAAQHGAQLTITIDASMATPAELAATARLPGVIAAAGPFAEVTIGLEHGVEALGPVTLAGRPAPGGPVDDVVLQSGHWAAKPGQVVLSAGELPPGVTDGTQITVTGVPRRLVLTVVGVADSVTGSAGGWVDPAEIASLRAPGALATAQMLYRFRSAGSTAAVRADTAAISAALPAGAVTASRSYLAVRAQSASGIAPIVPFLAAFGVIGLIMSALTVANVVSGAVVAGYRRIGILKGIGFTPGQVAAAYTGLAAMPAAAGCLGGVVLGNLLAVPLLARTARAYGVGSLGVPAWANLGVAAAMCCLTGIAAVVPAARAGRLTAAQALAAGRAPRTGRGYAAHRLLGTLPLPRPVTIGLAAPFTRPARTAGTLAAVLLGATAVTLATGLSTVLSWVVDGLTHAAAEPVQVAVPPASAGAAQRVIAAALRAQPGTLHYVAEADLRLSVTGLAQQVPVTVFRGDAAWTGYDLISGRWYSRPGQADVPSGFLTATGTRVGDTVTVTAGGKPVPVRIVGQVFDTGSAGLTIITGWQTLASADPGLAPDQYDVGLRPGTSAAAYAQALSTKLGPGYGVGAKDQNSRLAIVLGLIGFLTLLLAVVAGLGVFNTVVLQTRERAHDLAVFRAVGMTPPQTIAMVLCTAAATGLAAGVIALPAGVALLRCLVPVMAADAGTGLPTSFLNVYQGWELAALALAGAVIAAAGALAPASLAARSPAVTALRAE